MSDSNQPVIPEYLSEVKNIQLLLVLYINNRLELNEREAATMARVFDDFCKAWGIPTELAEQKWARQGLIKGAMRELRRMIKNQVPTSTALRANVGDLWSCSRAFLDKKIP